MREIKELKERRERERKRERELEREREREERCKSSTNFDISLSIRKLGMGRLSLWDSESLANSRCQLRMAASRQHFNAKH
jgi:hypothetical protein